MKYDRCTLQRLNNLPVIADVAGHKLGTDGELGLVPAGSSVTSAERVQIMFAGISLAIAGRVETRFAGRNITAAVHRGVVGSGQHVTSSCAP